VSTLISEALPFGRLWYGEPNAISNAIGYAKFYSRSHDAVIHVYDAAGNVIETHEQAGQFKEVSVFVSHQVHARDQAGAVSASSRRASPL
jgi:hypothetical protein